MDIHSIRSVMSGLDGSNASVVSMMTGYSKAELIELGGVPEASEPRAA